MIDQEELFAFRASTFAIALALIREVQREEQAAVESMGRSGFNFQRWHQAFFTIWISIAREWGPVVEEVLETESHKESRLLVGAAGLGSGFTLKQFGVEEATAAEINGIVTNHALSVVTTTESEWAALGAPELLWGEAQAEMLAATETAQATGWTQHTVATQSRMILLKIWQSISDDRTRPSHLDANGQRRLLNEPFDVGGALLQWPADAGGPLREIINCRCWEDYELLQPPGLLPQF